MSSVYLVAGVLLVTLALVDAFWTALWVDGHAGPLTTRHNSWLQRLVWWPMGSDNHRLLSATGAVILVASVLVWAVLTWTGWVVLFSADPGALRHSHTGAAATLVDRIYFTGYTMFTLGNGDFSPQSPGFKVATALASMTGLLVVTLSLTYLVSIVQAVVTKRSFASQVLALGATPEELLLHSWDGERFADLELQLLSLTEQLNTVSEQHEAYPMLYFYHAANERQSVPVGLAVLDDALTLLAFGVRGECRPAPAALHCARQSVRFFLDSLRDAHIAPAREPGPPPDLHRLRAAGIPTVGDRELAARLAELTERRRMLKSFLESERRSWPGSDR